MVLRTVLLSFGLVVAAERTEDLVTELPGFPPASTWGFKAYSGLLNVPGPVCGYDALRIHYQFHTSQSDASKDPLVTWHQGGPGGSSIDVGLYGEMGAFQVGDKVHGMYLNPYAWNKVANMLYLESPAGSGQGDGFSQCIKDGVAVTCHWSDKTQAEAYSHSLVAFLDAFPEFAKHDLYLTGESYFGQYGPNIAHFILNNEPFKTQLHLKGIAAGNACWGGTETCVACNGPSNAKIDVENFFGKALFSPTLKAEIDAECAFATTYSAGAGHGPFACDGDHKLSTKCHDLLSEMHQQVGRHNVYDIYDNCPNTQVFLDKAGKDMQWLTNKLRQGLTTPGALREELLNISGGYTWDCGGNVGAWIKSPEVMKALHLDGHGSGSGFAYESSGPASITLWPELSKKLRVLIYNGDADACVPWVGNEDWVFGLYKQGTLNETAPWSPWFTKNKACPAGYITKFKSPEADFDFHFATIRLAGHMAPTFMPEASLVMLTDFLHGPGSSQEEPPITPGVTLV